MYEIEKVWKDWTIVRLIGEGSFGKVYEVERKNYGIEEHCALKVITIPQSDAEVRMLRNEGMDDQSVTSYYLSLVKDFAQEISLMSKLKGNPGIVDYYDYAIVEHEGEMGWDILIRMELLKPLSEDMRMREYTRDDILNLGIELCKALSVCHKKNIIHRDIKIDNIFVSDTGNYKLGDFGVARTIEKTTSGLSKKGTYSYMAPEVYKGEAYGSRADIYSLGMVMYKLANYNREPFLPLPPEPIKYSDKNDALVRRMKGERFANPANADIMLVGAIMRACSYSQELRYQSADQMRADLERVRLQQPGAAQTPTFVPPAYQNTPQYFPQQPGAARTPTFVPPAYQNTPQNFPQQPAWRVPSQPQPGYYRSVDPVRPANPVNPVWPVAPDRPANPGNPVRPVVSAPVTQPQRFSAPAPQDLPVEPAEESTVSIFSSNVPSYPVQQPPAGAPYRPQAAPVMPAVPMYPANPVNPVNPVNPAGYGFPAAGVTDPDSTVSVFSSYPGSQNAPSYPYAQPVRQVIMPASHPKPDAQSKFDRPLNENEWRCPKCGKIHMKYVGTCGCGEQKPESAGPYIPSYVKK